MTQTNNDFLARLGLEADPFPADADSSFYYENADLMQRLDMIQHLIGFSNQMIFITGEKGVGKTSMLDRLEYYAPDHWRICRIQANSMLNTPILLRQITSGFELEITAGADDMIQVYSEELQDHIETLERAMLTPVVLIDDAHELPIDAFTMLFGFMQQDGGHSRLKMALFCEPEIITMLDSPQLKSVSQNLTHQLEIPPFDEQQTGEYLEQRISHAGSSGDFPFLPDVVHKIHTSSKGLAGSINTLAQQALLNEDTQTFPVVDEVLEFEEEIEEVFPAISSTRANAQTPIGRKFHSWQIGAVAAVLSLLAVVLWLTSQFSDESVPSTVGEIPLEITPKPTEQDPTLFEESTSPFETGNTDLVVSPPEQTETDQTIIDVPPLTTEEKTVDALDEFVEAMDDNHQLDSGHDVGITDHQHDEVTVQIDEKGNPQIVETIKSEASVTEKIEAPSAKEITAQTTEKIVAVKTTVIEKIPEPEKSISIYNQTNDQPTPFLLRYKRRIMVAYSK